MGFGTNYLKIKNKLIYKCISLFIKEKMDNYLSKYSSNIIEELFPFYNVEIYNIMKENRYFFQDMKRDYSYFENELVKTK